MSQTQTLTVSASVSGVSQHQLVELFTNLALTQINLQRLVYLAQGDGYFYLEMVLLYQPANPAHLQWINPLQTLGLQTVLRDSVIA